MALYDYGETTPQDDWFAQQGPPAAPAPGAPPTGGGGVGYNQVIVQGPNGWWKSSPDPNAPWHGPNGEILPPGQSPPGMPPPSVPGAPRGTPEELQEAARRSAQGYSGTERPAATTGPQFTGNPKADFMALVAGRPVSTQTLAEIFPQFAAWYPGSSFEKGDIKGPWGWADVIGGLDNPNKPDKWQWYTGSGSAAGGGSILSGGMGSLADLAKGALATSPGYKFRLEEGQKALERSAAARGTLLGGGQAKALTRYGQDFAANEYAANYARLFGEQNARYNQLYGLSALGLNAAGQAANLGSGYAGQAGAFGQNYAGQAGAAGQNYAGQAGNLYANQAGSGADLITQGANAQAAGTVGGANAAAGGLNASTSAANQLLLLYLLNQNRAPVLQT